MGLRWTCRRCRFWQKKKINLFRWSSFWSWRVCKQANLSHLGHSKIACIHLKADAPKTSHCLVRILVQRAMSPQKWARRGRYSQWWSFSGHVERIFVHKNWRGGYWQHLVSTGRCYVPHSRSYTRCFASCFWRWKLSAAELMSFGRLRAVIWHRWTINCGVPWKISVTPTS